MEDPGLIGDEIRQQPHRRTLCHNERHPPRLWHPRVGPLNSLLMSLAPTPGSVEDSTPVRLPPTMNRSTISVVIPVKDDADHLRRCLMALSEQTFAPTEVIVVDNGSTDDSANVALSFGARVLREDRPGIPAASAAGYDAASADIIARLDADSVAPTDWLERIAATFDWSPTVTAVTGGGYFTDGPRAWRHLGARLYLGTYFVLVGGALGHTPLFGSNCAFRRSEWMRVGSDVHRFDPMVHDDIDLSMHLGPQATIRLDRNLQMGISSRPFSATPTEMRIRFRRGVHSLTIHWPQESPLRRHVRRAGRLWRKRLASLPLHHSHRGA